MSECACGCGEITAGGTFRPGHDAKLRGRLEGSVGGLLVLEEIVGEVLRHTDGDSTADALSVAVKRLVSQGGG